MGLQSNPHNPCVYSGYIHDPDDPSDDDSTVPITMGLYLDDFIYFSSSNKVEEKFQRILSFLIKVDFMRTVEWFLGTDFSWRQTPEETSVHMNKSGFSRNLVERFKMQDCNVTPVCTP